MKSVVFTVITKYIWPISFMMLAIVTIASLAPLPVLPEVPGSDKTHHLISYALIAFPISLVKPKYWSMFLFVVVILSGAIELIQPYVNRYGEWLDLLANIVGIIIGLGIAVLVTIFRKKQY